MPNRVKLPVRYKREWDIVRVTTSKEKLVNTILKLSDYVGNKEISIVKGKRSVGEARILRDGDNKYAMIAFYDKSPYIPSKIVFYINVGPENCGKRIAEMVMLFEDVRKVREEIKGDEMRITFNSKLRRIEPFSHLNPRESVEMEIKLKRLEEYVELKVKKIKIGTIEFEMSE
ncbi:hypothetical protein [Pyrococcus sp. NA2]|uniref:hypothetical protein n=1 Tax=Pyrococcus sp. (strain NA2) TaxID=342949 RepID=UPI001ED96D8E|nr:hypothetical protein [Pyrococcus sp. NA2]